MIRVGIVGFGFMGKTHLRCYGEVAGVRVAAICDADAGRLKDTRKTAGNIEAGQSSLDLSEVALYTDFEKMLAAGKLDAVSITLPTFLHRDFTVKVLQAGVHVLCEKPMAMDTGECEEMIAAARKTRRELQIGHCIRFWPEYAATKRMVESGKYGKVLTVSLRRISAVPGWSWKNWLVNQHRSGGALMDLHIHDTDYVQYLFGLPKAVRSQGCIGPTGGFDYVTTQYDYGAGLVVTAEGGFVRSAGWPFEMSFNISLQKATIVYDCTRSPAFQVYPAKGGCVTPKVEAGDGWSREIAHFVKKISDKRVVEIITPVDSLNAVKLILAERNRRRQRKRCKSDD